jgi:hypothetical protein
MWSFGSDNHPLFVRVHAVFVPCLFPEDSVSIFVSLFLYPFLLPYKNMKTNVAPLSSVHFRFVFIPTLKAKEVGRLELGHPLPAPFGGAVARVHAVLV